MTRPTEEQIEKFFKNVRKTEACWIWLLSKSPRYGYTRLNNKRIYAHRFSVMIEKEIPKGFVVDHLCKNTMCVNPKHLDIVLQRENVRRGNHTKLTKEEVVEIRRLYLKKELNQPELAKKYGVGCTHISRIIHNKEWKF